MPDPALQAYLASKYLSGPKADAILAHASGSAGEGSKKRKKRRVRETEEGGEGLRIVEADGGWAAREEDDDDEATVVKGKNEEKKWARLGATAGSDAPASSEQPEADAEAAQQPPEEAPAKPSKPKAGLKTREEMRAARLARQAAEAEAAKTAGSPSSSAVALPSSREQQQEAEQQATIYRDSSGRIIDVAADDLARKKAKEEEERFEREKKGWNRGEVQKRLERERREEAEKVREEGVSRSANDARMNATLRSVVRADDPALAFLTKSRTSGPRKPEYTGPAPAPNRFGIKPGYRWDGVDRGNGFEKRRFAAINKRKTDAEVEQAWRQEDM